MDTVWTGTRAGVRADRFRDHLLSQLIVRQPFPEGIRIEQHECHCASLQDSKYDRAPHVSLSMSRLSGIDLESIDGLGNEGWFASILAMKSGIATLRTRGFVSDSDYLELIPHRRNNCESGLTHEDAAIRTAAIRFIKAAGLSAFIPLLCDLLKKEKKLYTKIELCDCLASFGNQSTPHLLPLIGKIGNNRHKVVGNHDLNKKSYPLPRDIVARILIRIGPDCFELIKPAIRKGTNEQVSELLDVIGHITFTSRDFSLESEVVNIYTRADDELIAWKCIRAFQGFRSKAIVAILQELINNPKTSPIFKAEAERSLRRIRERTEHAR